MSWNIFKTVRNTLHVINSEDGSHFEAKTEDEVHEVLDELEHRKQAAAEAEAAAAANDPNKVNLPVGEAPSTVEATSRAN
jgi:hypothetical protein